MSDPTEFLLARIAEDEAHASAAIAPDELYPWGDRALPRRRAEDVPEDVRGYLGGTWGEHFAQHAPLRVLAECEAKRRIITEHGPETEDGGWNATVTYCRVCRYDDGLDRDIYPCRTLHLLALPYVDHPDYDEAWRP